LTDYKINTTLLLTDQPLMFTQTVKL